MEYNDSDTIMKLFDITERYSGDSPFPAACPVCGKKAGHIYMHRYDKENHGGMWAWCSSCGSFSHASCSVPAWWRNMSLFTILDLRATPDNLDTQAPLIDDFVNKLLAIKDDKAFRESTKITPCEKCGTPMIRELPEGHGGGFSMTCPKCGWGFATSYFDPICLDQTEYQITLLEGNPASTEVIRAVNQVAHRNFIKSRELILSAPHVIFKGKALAIHEKTDILDAASILYRIEPDYPYE